MEILTSGYLTYALSFISIFIGLTTILYLQFSVTGITNFGIVGFWGLGMYLFSIFLVTYQIPFILALLLAAALTGLLAMALGRIILNLDSQAVLVGTLAFATIIEYLATTEKWATNGVIGFGTVTTPFDFGAMTNFAYFLVIFAVVVLLMLYAYQLKKSPYGRLLLSIKDNENLSQSLGKPVFRHKIIFFTVTCAVTAVLGAMSAPLYSYIYPRMIGSGITFTIWIALLLGGRTRLSGGVVGVLATVGLFDYIVETVLPIPMEYKTIVPNIKYFIYGLTLILILMYRPSGIMAEKKRRVEK
jgi:branched-chain amino acid transport system permease protein